jgi:uncharacterized protein (UPF0332 family)
VSKAIASGRYMEEAQRAVEGARVLLDAGDIDGAHSRAYYAVFDAGHAALRAAWIETQSAEIKTHDGLTVLGKKLTKWDDADLDKTLNRVQLRQVADCAAEPLEVEKARGTVEQADALVAAIHGMIARLEP